MDSLEMDDCESSGGGKDLDLEIHVVERKRAVNGVRELGVMSPRVVEKMYEVKAEKK